MEEFSISPVPRCFEWVVSVEELQLRVGQTFLCRVLLKYCYTSVKLRQVLRLW